MLVVSLQQVATETQLRKQINERVRLTAFVNLGRYIVLIHAWSVMFYEAV